MSELPSNLHIISYVSRAFINRGNSLSATLSRIPGIKYRIYSEDDIPHEFIDRIGAEIWGATKGAGYYSWKPWIINDYLKTLSEGDLVIYVDAGCITNLDKPYGRRKLNEYLDMVRDPTKCGLLRYELVGLPENKYTNQYFWDYMCARFPGTVDTNYYHTSQLVAGILFMRKCQWVCDLFSEAVSIIIDNPELISEIHTKPGEIHRHDQSILSLLYKIRGGDLVIPVKLYPRYLTIKERMITPFLVAHKRR